jgi:PAS domain S-box-containing protein
MDGLMDGHASGPIVEADADGRYLDGNDAALELFGLSRDDLRRRCVGDFAPEGLAAIHLALFRWVVRTGHDFGGGTSTIVRPDGTSVRVDCTSIEPRGDTFRLHLEPQGTESVPPHSDTVASVLDAWREAEREIGASGRTEPEYAVARKAAETLRDIYQYVVREKEAALARIDGE